MRSFIEYVAAKGDEDLLESRPYKRAVAGVATHQNQVLTGEKATINNEDPYANELSKKKKGK